MATVAERTEWLHRLLRGQLSAVETYQQGVAKCKGESCETELQSILSEHRQTVETLSQHLRERGETPDSSSGVWGSWANLVTGTARLFGEKATFKALKEGEEHGLKEYESALADEHLDPECKSLILNTLIPQQKRHIATIDRLMDSL
jgi:uncharacterized protein (TIGR02284 family)